MLGKFLSDVPSLPDLAKMFNHFFINDLHRGRHYTAAELGGCLVLQNLLAGLAPFAPAAAA